MKAPWRCRIFGHAFFDSRATTTLGYLLPYCKRCGLKAPQ